MESPSFLSPFSTSGNVSSSDYNSDYPTDIHASTSTLRNSNAAHGNQRKSSKKSVSSFIQKLYSILENNTHADLISWTPAGSSFTVSNAKVFAAKVLPTHFKHSNFSSFVRLLNMYGFHKISKSTRRQRSSDNEIWEFSHIKFIRGRPDLLKDIKRKAMDSEMMRRETGDIQASFAMLQMSQADLIQQFYTLQQSFTNLLGGLEESRRIQQQQAAQIRQLSEQQGLFPGHNNKSNNSNSNLHDQAHPSANQLQPPTSMQQPQHHHHHRRTTSTPSLPSNETIYQIQDQRQQQQPPQRTGLNEPFKIMVTTPSNSNTVSGLSPQDRTNSLNADAYWMNKSIRSFSQPPEIQGNSNNDTSNRKLAQSQQQQLAADDPNMLFSPMTFQSAVNTPLPPSPMILGSPDLDMSPGSSEDSLGSYVFNLGQANTLDPAFL